MVEIHISDEVTLVYDASLVTAEMGIIADEAMGFGHDAEGREFASFQEKLLSGAVGWLFPCAAALLRIRKSDVLLPFSPIEYAKVQKLLRDAPVAVIKTLREEVMTPFFQHCGVFSPNAPKRTDRRERLVYSIVEKILMNELPKAFLESTTSEKKSADPEQ